MPPTSGPAICIGRVTLLPTQRQVLLDNEPANVGGRAFDLLQALVVRPGEVVGKRELLEAVWPGMVVEENNLQVQVCALRKLLGNQAIVTVPGRGYTLAAPVQVRDADLSVERAARAYRPVPFDIPPLRGRELELEHLVAMLSIHRFVTVAGPAGVGKSRLLQAAFAHLVADGSTWVELADVPDAVSLASHLARVMLLDIARSPSPREVAKALAGRSALLMVENAERRLDEMACLAEHILEHAPGVRLVCTSQATVKCRDEHVLRLAPLDLPAADDLARASDAPVILLLHDGLTAVQPRDAFTPRELPDAIAICRHLDGLPLAILLAGARVPLLGLGGVRRLLPDRFRLLKSEARGGPARHASLLASIEGNWGLLSARECLALVAVSRFPGRFTLSMARQALHDIAANEWEAVELLAGLVDKSLVVADPGGSAAFRVLENTRLFARSKLRTQQTPPVH